MLEDIEPRRSGAIEVLAGRIRYRRGREISTVGGGRWHAPGPADLRVGGRSRTRPAGNSRPAEVELALGSVGERRVHGKVTDCPTAVPGPYNSMWDWLADRPTT